MSERIVGADEWAKLSPDVQARIGAVAIELVAAWEGLDWSSEGSATRPFEAADGLLNDRLQILVNNAVPVIAEAEEPLIPSQLGQICRVCGCSQEDACEAGCGWHEPGLCTACAGEIGRG